MKYMAIKPLEGDNPPVIVFQHSQSNFFFTNSAQSACFIKPHFIIYDGDNVLIYDNSDGDVEIGFSCMVERPKGLFVGRKTSILFDQLIAQTIRANLYKLFPSIKIRTAESDAANHLDRPCGVEKDVLPSQIEVIQTNRAGYSLDHKTLYSFYFVRLPPGQLKMIPAQDTPPCRSILLSDFIRTGLVAFKLNFLSKAIAIMLGTGDIVLPTIE